MCVGDPLFEVAGCVSGVAFVEYWEVRGVGRLERGDGELGGVLLRDDLLGGGVGEVGVYKVEDDVRSVGVDAVRQRCLEQQPVGVVAGGVLPVGPELVHCVLLQVLEVGEGVEAEPERGDAVLGGDLEEAVEEGDLLGVPELGEG